MIVSLLDLNPTVPGQEAEKLEIFEAGTGHGALTLFLSRAIHGANTLPPRISLDEADPEKAKEYDQWLSNRRAVINTLDISEAHSRHAQKTVANFRGGIYASNINFHTGTIEDYLRPQLESGEKPFLDHAILDLPSTHAYLDLVSQAMKSNATLITFCPSITQINACVEFVKEQNLPLFLETVLEIGGSVGVGGKEWDVRRVKVRQAKRAPSITDKTTSEQETASATSTDGENVSVEEALQVLPVEEEPALAVEAEERWEMVCRPKVGLRVVGGGFVGLWRKKAP